VVWTVPSPYRRRRRRRRWAPTSLYTFPGRTGAPGLGSGSAAKRSPNLTPLLPAGFPPGDPYPSPLCLPFHQAATSVD
jgi:hypothetical protein